MRCKEAVVRAVGELASEQHGARRGFVAQTEITDRLAGQGYRRELVRVCVLEAIAGGELGHKQTRDGKQWLRVAKVAASSPQLQLWK